MLKEKETTNPKASEPYIKLVSGSPIIEGNLKGTVFLSEDERRMYRIAQGISLDELPLHRQEALKTMLGAFRTDYVITKMYMTLSNEGMV